MASIAKLRKRDELYQKECAGCKLLPYPPQRREVYPGTFMWLHNGHEACAAGELREKHKREDAIASQKEIA